MLFSGCSTSAATNESTAPAPAAHLEEQERARFLIEARRVAPELIVLDAGLHEGSERAEWQERELTDQTRWVVYKRFFSVQTLLAELGGGEVLFSGTWFVCVRAS